VPAGTARARFFFCPPPPTPPPHHEFMSFVVLCFVFQAVVSQEGKPARPLSPPDVRVSEWWVGQAGGAGARWTDGRAHQAATGWWGVRGEDPRAHTPGVAPPAAAGAGSIKEGQEGGEGGDGRARAPCTGEREGMMEGRGRRRERRPAGAGVSLFLIRARGRRRRQRSAGLSLCSTPAQPHTRAHAHRLGQRGDQLGGARAQARGKRKQGERP